MHACAENSIKNRMIPNNNLQPIHRTVSMTQCAPVAITLIRYYEMYST